MNYFFSSYGLVGIRTQDSSKDFQHPLVIAYFNVDYKKNPKGTKSSLNYHLILSFSNYLCSFIFDVRRDIVNNRIFMLAY